MTPTNRPAQTERADPLNGAGGPPQVTGTSRTLSQAPEVDPGKALGVSARGDKVPAGEDRHPPQPDAMADASPAGQPASPQPGDEEEEDEHNDDETIGGHIGGSGAAARKFGKPSAASAYDSSTNGLTGGPTPSRIFSGRVAGTPGSGTAKKAAPRDNGVESEGEEDY
jgi:hypothetical protein